MHALHQLHRFSKALLSFHFMFSSLILYANLAQHMWVRNETREWFYFLILPPSYSLLQVSLLFSLFCFSALIIITKRNSNLSFHHLTHCPSSPDLTSDKLTKIHGIVIKRCNETCFLTLLRRRTHYRINHWRNIFYKSLMMDISIKMTGWASNGCLA
jgi:hypothetical protein